MMIHFVVVAGDPRAVREREGVLDAALDATRIVGGSRVRHRGASGTWVVAAEVSGDPICDERIAADRDALFLVNGPALSRRSAQPDLAACGLSSFRVGGSRALVDTLRGTYNAVAIDPGHGVRALGDVSGLFPVYWWSDDDVVIVSNRSTTVREAAGRSGWDLRRMGWLLGHANVFGPEVPAAGVSSVPAGTQLMARWGAGSARLERSPVWLWPGPDHQPSATLSDDDWDRAAADLVEGMRLAAEVHGGSLRLQLTGGKDSRLCLALAREAVGAEAVEAVTNGPADSPEVAFAALVAEVAGVTHRRVGPPAPTAGGPEEARAPDPPFDAESYWTRLRQHVHRHECLVCPWDGVTLPLRGVSLNVRGFGGELYRRSHAKRFRTAQVGSVTEMADLFVDFHQRHDPLGVLRPDERRFQVDWLRRWVADAAEETRFDLLPERFYVENRLGHWNGPMGQNTPTRIAINPLLSSEAMRTNLELTVEERVAERFHYEVLRRTAPDLVDVPFLGDSWSPRLGAPPPRPCPEAAAPTAMPTTSAVRRSWQWRFLEQEAGSVAAVILEAGRTTALGELCDTHRLAEATSRIGDLGVAPAKQILSGLLLSLALLGEGEAFLDEPVPLAALR